MALVVVSRVELRHPAAERAEFSCGCRPGRPCPGWCSGCHAVAGKRGSCERRIGFLNYRRSFDDFLTVTSTALAVLREFGDRHGKGRALNNLGAALQGIHRFDDAIDAHTQALTIYRDLGDRHREGSTLNASILPEGRCTSPTGRDALGRPKADGYARNLGSGIKNHNGAHKRHA
ncbi:tetratricopeptide repeat protein [Streptomyces sp. NPDC005931]|uniref:tetratricopeptide repeat protein n=1 Tax=Streptomyces sp. NPDC005931 TaxID=3364737 RepID=UPI0036B91F8B